MRTIGLCVMNQMGNGYEGLSRCKQLRRPVGLANEKELTQVTMYTVREYGRDVVVLSPILVRLAAPLFKKSMPHRGRILRLVGKRRGPVIRDYHGLY